MYQLRADHPQCVNDGVKYPEYIKNLSNYDDSPPMPVHDDDSFKTTMACVKDHYQFGSNAKKPFKKSMKAKRRLTSNNKLKLENNQLKLESNKKSKSGDAGSAMKEMSNKIGRNDERSLKKLGSSLKAKNKMIIDETIEISDSNDHKSLIVCSQ